LIEHVGKNAKSMMSRSRPVGVRYFSDFYAPKLPSSKQARHGGNGPTSFHQDFTNFSVDRSGGMTFWVALEDYGPEFGTMSFVNGSHRLGVLGNYRTYQKGEDLLDIYPNLRNDLMLVQPVDACWTGAPAEAFDCSGMQINQPLPEDRFPTLVG
jgi:hypothetical protein